jgi:hypothetical protein
MLSALMEGVGKVVLILPYSFCGRNCGAFTLYAPHSAVTVWLGQDKVDLHLPANP